MLAGMAHSNNALNLIRVNHKDTTFAADSPQEKGGNTIKDLTHWVDYLDHQTQPLAGLIKAKIQRIESGGPGAEYAQRELQAIHQAFRAYTQFKEFVILYLNDLADAYLAERAKARAYEKRSEKLWNTAFKGAMETARLMGRELDRKLQDQQKKAS